MNRIRIAIAAAAAGVLALVLIVASAQAATPTLIGTTGPDSAFTIGLKKAGKKVVKLKAGKYRIVVRDTASSHNFRLKGPGINKATSVSGKGTFTWTVTLKKGKYTYVCDPHSGFMRGTFVVS